MKKQYLLFWIKGIKITHFHNLISYTSLEELTPEEVKAVTDIMNDIHIWEDFHLRHLIFINPLTLL